MPAETTDLTLVDGDGDGDALKLVFGTNGVVVAKTVHDGRPDSTRVVLDLDRQHELHQALGAHLARHPTEDEIERAARAMCAIEDDSDWDLTDETGDPDRDSWVSDEDKDCFRRMARAALIAGRCGGGDLAEARDLIRRLADHCHANAGQLPPTLAERIATATEQADRAR